MIYIKNPTSREELHAIPIDMENLSWKPSDNWKPVQHGILADSIIRSINECGLVPGEELWEINRTGSGMVGTVEVQNLKSKGIDETPAGVPLKFMLGVRHANNGSRSVQICLGAQITVCSNGLFIGEVKSHGKHTANLSLDELVQGTIQEYIIKCKSMGAYISDLKGVSLDDGTAAYLVLELMQEFGVYPNRLIQYIWTDWKEPQHQEFRPRNLWSLYNCVTAAAKLQPSGERQLETLEALYLAMEILKVVLKRN